MNPDKEQKIGRVSTRRDFLFRKLPATAAAMILAACEPYGQRERSMEILRKEGLLGELTLVSLKNVLGPDSSDLQVVSGRGEGFIGGIGDRDLEFLLFAWEDNTPGRRIAVSRLPLKRIAFERKEDESAKPTFRLNGVDLNAHGFKSYEDPRVLKELRFVYSTTFSLPPEMLQGIKRP